MTTDTNVLFGLLIVVCLVGAFWREVQADRPNIRELGDAKGSGTPGLSQIVIVRIALRLIFPFLCIVALLAIILGCLLLIFICVTSLQRQIESDGADMGRKGCSLEKVDFLYEQLSLRDNGDYLQFLYECSSG